MESKQAVAQQILSVLGRQARPDEIEHLSRFIDSGELDAAEIGQVLQSSPEYQDSLLKKQGQEYGNLLAANDAQTVGDSVRAANSTLAGLGRQGSSAVDMAGVSAAGNLAAQRQNALAAFYGRGLQNNAGLAGQQGMNALNRGYGLRDEARQRNYQIEDYYRQQNDYNTAKKSAGGWNAITPEFAVNAAIGTAGKIGAAYAGGMAGGGGGLFASQAAPKPVSVLERQQMGPSWNGW